MLCKVVELFILVRGKILAQNVLKLLSVMWRQLAEIYNKIPSFDLIVKVYTPLNLSLIKIIDNS